MPSNWFLISHVVYFLMPDVEKRCTFQVFSSLYPSCLFMWVYVCAAMLWLKLDQWADVECEFECPFCMHVLPNVVIRMSRAVCLSLCVHTTSWACLESAVWQGDGRRKVGQSCPFLATDGWMKGDDWRGMCMAQRLQLRKINEVSWDKGVIRKELHKRRRGKKKRVKEKWDAHTANNSEQRQKV